MSASTPALEVRRVLLATVPCLLALGLAMWGCSEESPTEAFQTDASPPSVPTLSAHELSAEDDPIHSCLVSESGRIRVVDGPDDCRENEVPLSWNRQGPEGEPGPQGEVGPMGPEGPQGPAGLGPQGLAAVSSDPALLRGVNVESVELTPNNNVRVTFTSAVDVANGYYIVTPGLTGTCLRLLSAEASTNNSVIVVRDGSLICPFSLVVY